tara:strand:- start:384 stop:815 length:432 start_codon:yes stop_codon:yes gene_type:complete
MATKKFEEIVNDFEILDEWEDRYRYIIDLGKNIPELKKHEKTPETKVNGCASQVWLLDEIKLINNKKIFFISGDSDALIVKGLIGILIKMYNNVAVNEAIKIDAVSQFKRLGLDEHLSAQRSNGLNSMINRINNVLKNSETVL